MRSVTAFLMGFSAVGIILGGPLGMILGLIWMIENNSALAVILGIAFFAAILAGLGNVTEAPQAGRHRKAG